MSKIKYDLTGKRFGRLVVLHYAENQNSGNPKWTVKCDCGRIKDVESRALRSGTVYSCGCLRKEKRKAEQKQRQTNTAELMKKMKTIRAKPIPDKEVNVDVPLAGYIGKSLKMYGNTVLGEKYVRRYGKSAIIRSVKNQLGFDVKIERTLNDTLVLKVKKERKHDQND